MEKTQIRIRHKTPTLLRLTASALRLRAVLSFIVSVGLFAPELVIAERFVIEGAGDSVVGETRYTRSRGDDTLIDIAREFDLGYDQIVSANPGVNRWIPGDGAKVTLPHVYILPGSTRRGLVLNIADLRLYYYPVPRKGSQQEVFTYPVSIGRMDWRTPLGATKIVRKERDPVWRPPPSIRLEHARDGDPLPEAIPGGSPDNPLGRFALRLGIPTYLIHGVDERKAFGIGMRVTHGCIRMYPEDIEHLFGLVSVNTQVLLVDEPVKVGKRGGSIFLSVHQPLDEGEDEEAPPLARVSLAMVMQQLRKSVGPNAPLDMEAIAKITEVGDGVPHELVGGDISPRPYRQEVRNESESPVRSRSALDAEYNEAVSKYLKDEESTQEPTVKAKNVMSERGREVQRRATGVTTDRSEDDTVRRYLEERY